MIFGMHGGIIQQGGQGEATPNGGVRNSHRIGRMAWPSGLSLLAGAALLSLSVGCGAMGGELPPLVPADDTPEVNQFAVDLFDSKAGPTCAEVGRPDSTLQEEMFNALNEYRVQNGLQPLYYSQTLEQSADDMAEDLGSVGSSHTSIPAAVRRPTGRSLPVSAIAMSARTSPRGTPMSIRSCRPG